MDGIAPELYVYNSSNPNQFIEMVAGKAYEVIIYVAENVRSIVSRYKELVIAKEYNNSTVDKILASIERPPAGVFHGSKEFNRWIDNL